MRIENSERLTPGSRAALVVALPVILLEAASDVAPGIGFLATLPLAVVVYLVQGWLVVRYAGFEHDNALRPSAPVFRQALVSALLTGLVVSPVTALAMLTVLTPATLGAALIGLPAILGSTLIDLLLNVLLVELGAWMSVRAKGRFSWGATCAALAGALLITWTGVAALVVVLILVVLKVIPIR